MRHFSRTPAYLHIRPLISGLLLGGLLLFAPTAMAATTTDDGLGNPTGKGSVATVDGWTPTVTASGALNAMLNDSIACEGKVAAEKKDQDPLAKSKLSKENICPNLQSMPALASLVDYCKDAVKNLEKAFEDWQKAKKESCAATAGVQVACEGTSCNKSAQAAIEKAKAAAAKEMAAIKEAQKISKDIDHTVASILVNIGNEKERIEEVERQRLENPTTAAIHNNNEQVVASDNGAASLDLAKAKYQATAQRIKDAATKIFEAGQLPKNSGISGDTPSAEGDVVKIGQANNNLKNSLQARSDELARIRAELDSKNLVNDDRRIGGGSLTGPLNLDRSPSPTSEIPTAGLANAGMAAAAASGVAAASGDSKGKSGGNNMGSLGDLTDAGTGSLNVAGALTTQTFGNGRSATAALKAKNVDLTNSPAAKLNQPGTGTELDGTSASLSSPTSVRETLKARLMKSTGASVMGEVSKAGSAEESGKKSESGEKGKGNPTDSPKLINAQGEIVTDSTGLLGNSDFSLEGSETDSLVQSMVEGIGGSGGRELASLVGSSSQHFGMSEEQMVSEEGPSLFDRIKIKNSRYLERGNLSRGLRSKL